MTKTCRVLTISMLTIMVSNIAEAKFNIADTSSSANNFAGGGPPGGSPPTSGDEVPFDGGLSILLLTTGVYLRAKRA